MGEQDSLLVGCQRVRNDPVGPCADVGRGLTARYAVAPDGPAWHLLTNFGGSAALVLAVVPFHEVVADLSVLGHAGEATRLVCTGQRTAEHPDKRASAEPIAENRGLQPAQFSQRDVGTTGVPAVASPFSLPVPNKDEA